MLHRGRFFFRLFWTLQSSTGFDRFEMEEKCPLLTFVLTLLVLATKAQREKSERLSMDINSKAIFIHCFVVSRCKIEKKRKQILMQFSMDGRHKRGKHRFVLSWEPSPRFSTVNWTHIYLKLNESQNSPPKNASFRSRFIAKLINHRHQRGANEISCIFGSVQKSRGFCTVFMTHLPCDHVTLKKNRQIFSDFDTLGDTQTEKSS